MNAPTQRSARKAGVAAARRASGMVDGMRMSPSLIERDRLLRVVRSVNAIANNSHYLSANSHVRIALARLGGSSAATRKRIDLARSSAFSGNASARGGRFQRSPEYRFEADRSLMPGDRHRPFHRPLKTARRRDGAGSRGRGGKRHDALSLQRRQAIHHGGQCQRRLPFHRAVAGVGDDDMSAGSAPAPSQRRDQARCLRQAGRRDRSGRGRYGSAMRRQRGSVAAAM